MRKLLSLIAATTAITAAPALAQSTDWTGAYGGIQLGYANLDTNVGSSEDEFIGGIVGGYDYDLGSFVVGLGADYDFTDDVEIFRLKARGGFKIGKGLAYATAGYANADIDSVGSDDGYFVGGGYEHRITQSFSLGTEVLYHEFNSFNGTGADVDATTVQVRGTFRF